MTAPLVVLGAGGRLGRLLDRLWPDTVARYTRADLDIRDTALLINRLRGAGAVLCLAGVTHGSDRPMSLNTTLAELTLAAAADASAGRVFCMSSAAVYGRGTGPLRADAAPNPTSPYGVAKAEMEHMARAHPHPTTVLRLGNVAGADAILGAWQAGFSLDTFPDRSTPKRSYIGPETLARVFVTLATQADLPPVLNIAAGSVAMGALLDAAALDWTPRPAPPDAIADVTLDIDPLTALCAIDPDEGTAAAMVQQWHRARV
ncbi:MAG: NAD-dependent epimerase/dehydratase family protein [Pseudomonadota bacterium]